ncbi:hypothetical protein CASFOL_019456 [Castilleja foliolosa]|uniref:Uncharacterized protein n=1 Tax=Castilleja foliolosa TaxID=1961234 RepID=A0ABD3D8T1_9LAMI
MGNLKNDEILEIAKRRPIEDIRSFLFSEHFFTGPILQEIRERMAKMSPIQGLLSRMVNRESIHACVARLKFAEQDDPISAERYSMDLKKWEQVFGLSDSPVLFLKDVTTGLLNVHLDVIDKKRDGVEILNMYDRMLGVMLDDESLLKTVLRLQEASNSEFLLKYHECLGVKDKSKINVPSLANLACLGYKKRFRFLIDMHTLLDILDCSLLRIEYLSKSVLKVQKMLIEKCMG